MGKSRIVKYFAEEKDKDPNKTSYPIYTGMNQQDVFSNFILQNEGKTKDKVLIMFEQTKPAENNTLVITFLQDFIFFFSKDYPENSKIVDPVEIFKTNNIYKGGYLPNLKQGKHYIKKHLEDYQELKELYFLDNKKHYEYSN